MLDNYSIQYVRKRNGPQLAHYNQFKQEDPPIGGDTAKRDVTHLTLSYMMLAITCSESVPALPCINSHWRIDRDNNTTPTITVRLEYNHCNEK